MRGRLLPDPLERLSEPSSNDSWVSRNDVVHLFALPVVELGTDLNVFATEAPLKDVFHLVEKNLLLLDHVHMQLLLTQRVHVGSSSHLRLQLEEVAQRHLTRRALRLPRGVHNGHRGWCLHRVILHH